MIELLYAAIGEWLICEYHFFSHWQCCLTMQLVHSFKKCSVFGFFIKAVIAMWTQERSVWILSDPWTSRLLDQIDSDDLMRDLQKHVPNRSACKWETPLINLANHWAKNCVASFTISWEVSEDQRWCKRRSRQVRRERDVGTKPGLFWLNTTCGCHNQKEKTPMCSGLVQTKRIYQHWCCHRKLC